MILQRATLALSIALYLAHFWLMGQSLLEARRAEEERAKLRRLASLTIQHFPDRNVRSSGTFWKVIGRDAPMRDRWDHEYILESREVAGVKELTWRSLGNDGLAFTSDDVAVIVPYAEPSSSDAVEPPPLPGQPARDAK